MEKKEVEYTFDEIIDFKRVLKNWKSGNLRATFTILKKLNSAVITRDVLKRSRIGLYVKNISKQVDLTGIESLTHAEGDLKEMMKQRIKNIIGLSKQIFAKWKRKFAKKKASNDLQKLKPKKANGTISSDNLIKRIPTNISIIR